jgi:hypothetical protein
VIRDPEDKKKLEVEFKRIPKTMPGENQLYSHIDRSWHKNQMLWIHARMRQAKVGQVRDSYCILD